MTLTTMPKIEAPSALHRAERDLPFVTFFEGLDFQLLQASIEHGLWVVRTRFKPGVTPMPLVVLSADVLYGPTLPAALDKGEIPPGAPRDFGYVIDRANKVAQEKLVQLVPGAKHITKTHRGHNMMIDQPQLVTDAIREVVDAVPHGDRALSG
jgi:hypothetical protein